MKISTLPENEKERLESIKTFGILDSEDEPDFDSIVELACRLCDTSTSIITLIDEKRQWFKARKGLTIKETHRNISFCAHAILGNDVMIVNDTLLDERFFDNPLVLDVPHFRFYAGVPLEIAGGFKVGTLAVLDQNPKDLDEQQISALRILGKQVVNLLNLRLNISELKKRNNETNYLAHLVEQTGDAIISINEREFVKTWNRSSELLYGYKKEEVIGKSLKQFVGGAILNDSGTIADRLTDKKLWRGEVEHITKQGTKIQLLLTIASVADEDSLTTDFVLQLRDITERKALEKQLQIFTEEALRQSNQMRRLIMDSALDAIICIDITSSITFWNPQAEKIFGWTQEDIIGKKLQTIIPDQFKKGHEHGMQRYLETGEAVMLNRVMEITALNREGKEFPIELAITELNQNEGRSFCAFIRDISERKKAEKRYRNIFENNLDGIYQSTPEGEFITVNPAMASMLGYSSADDLMNSVTNIGTQIYSDPQERLRLMNLLENEGRANGFELRALKKNNETIWIRAHIQAIHNQQGGIKHFEGTVEDVTDRKRAEEKLNLQFEQLKKTNYELDKFVYSVSHDLRAPLASVLGIINVAELEVLTPVHKNYLDLIRESIQRLDGFIWDILDYSRNKRMSLQIEKINFQQLIKEMQNNLRLIKGADRLKVTVEIHDTVPFYSDKIRIAIILNNIFSNAIKYQDFKKGSSNLDISVAISYDKATIVMRDNGIGIPPKHLDKVFDMFYRAHDISKGSGLGLYIAKETVAKLQGSIKVESEYGVFTTFEISLANLFNTFRNPHGYLS